MIFKHLTFVILLLCPLWARAQLTEREFLAATENFEAKHSLLIVRKFLPRQSYIPVTTYWEKEVKDYPAGAWTSTRNGSVYLTIAGWVARLPGAKADDVDFTLCHEVGHQVASRSGIALERAADTFAVRDCLSLLWDQNDYLKRIDHVTEYSWEMRNHYYQMSSNRAYDKNKCTVKLMREAARGKIHSDKELLECDRSIHY
jgi:hypothetical protein